MATPPGSGTMPPARPSTGQASRTNPQIESSARPSTGQASRTTPQIESSAARLLIKNTQAHNSVNFKYSAEGPAAGVLSSTTNTDLATQAYRRNTVSYLHFLQRKIKVIISKVDSYKYELENEAKLLNSKQSSYAHNLNKRIQLLIAGEDSQRYKDIVKDIQQLKDEQKSHACDLDKKLKHLNDLHAEVIEKIKILNVQKDFRVNTFKIVMERLEAEEDPDRKIWLQDFNKKDFELTLERCTRELDITNAEAGDLDKQIQLLNAEKDAHAEKLGGQIQLLKARKGSLARNLVRLSHLLIARNNSYVQDLSKRFKRFHEKKALCDHDIGSEHELLESKLAPFAGCLDRQLELLKSKLVSCDRDFNKQQNHLDSNMKSYVLDVDNKMKLLKSEISYLGIDIELMK